MNNPTNDELAATNDELAATNDELAATNDELAATNDELAATNDESAATNDESAATNNQLAAAGFYVCPPPLLREFINTGNDDLQALYQGFRRAVDDFCMVASGANGQQFLDAQMVQIRPELRSYPDQITGEAIGAFLFGKIYELNAYREEHYPS